MHGSVPFLDLYHGDPELTRRLLSQSENEADGSEEFRAVQEADQTPGRKGWARGKRRRRPARDEN